MPFCINVSVRLTKNIQTSYAMKRKTKNVFYFPDKTIYHAVVIPGDDTAYFQEEHWEWKKKPYPLGMESGVILNEQVRGYLAMLWGG